MYLLKYSFLWVIFSQAASLSLLKLGFLETAKNPFQYLEEKNYPYENHTVVTQDGYKLLLVRIPHDSAGSPSKQTGPPVLFVHGLLANFYDFLVTGPGISYGFSALEKDYDIFLLNTRGNTWSRNHTLLDPDKDSEFWNFSFHEMGMYDLTATIDYITNLTGKSNVSYVGHSQGTTSFLAMATMVPEYNKKIGVAILLSPVAYLSYAKNFLVLFGKISPNLNQVVVKILHLNEILPYNYLAAEVASIICGPKSLFLPICKGGLALITGFSTQTNNSIVSAYLTNAPSGCSVKQMLHYFQIANTGNFQQYDYGKTKNVVKYGQSTPPLYNLSAVTSPIAMFYGASDYFTSLPDANRLARDLQNLLTNTVVPYKKTNHLDPLIGKKAKELFTDPGLKILDKYNDF